MHVALVVRVDLRIFVFVWACRAVGLAAVVLAEWAAAEVALAVVGVVRWWARVRAEECIEVQAGVAVVRAAGVLGALACAWVSVAFACADELGPCCQVRSCRAGLPCVDEVVLAVCTV